MYQLITGDRNDVGSGETRQSFGGFVHMQERCRVGSETEFNAYLEDRRSQHSSTVERNSSHPSRLTHQQSRLEKRRQTKS